MADTLKSAIRALLVGDAAVDAIVDGRVSGGGDPIRGQASVVYFRTNRGSEPSFDGPDSLAHTIIQVNSYDSSDFKAETLSDAVRVALDGFNGTTSGVAISYIDLQDESDLDTFNPGNKRVSRHGVRQDYFITYTEN